MQVSRTRKLGILQSYTLAPFGSPVAALFGFRPGMVVVGILLMFVVTLGAILIYMLTLPSDRGGGK